MDRVSCLRISRSVAVNQALLHEERENLPVEATSRVKSATTVFYSFESHSKASNYIVSCPLVIRHCFKSCGEGDNKE
jgi:hypothetical protein